MMKLVTKSAVNAVDVARLKEHLRIDGDDANARLGNSLNTAIAVLDGPDGELGRALINQTWCQTLPGLPRAGALVELELTPVSSISSVEYLDENGAWVALSETSYELMEIDGRHYVRAGAWPRGSKSGFSHRITYVAGYGAAPEDVPEPIRHAIILLASHFDEMSSPVVYGETPVEVPISINRLLAGYKILWR